MASAFTDKPRGFRNSSPSTSPGWVVTRLGVATPLVVVDDFDMFRTLLGPGETDAPLIVDPDRVLTAAVASQAFQPGLPAERASRQGRGRDEACRAFEPPAFRCR